MEEYNTVEPEKVESGQVIETSSPKQLMPLKNLGTYDIPEWALYYLEYGEDDALSEKETSMVDDWVKQFPNGYNMDVNWNEYNELDSHPAFGERNESALTSHGESPYLATKTYEVTFYDPIERETSYIETQDKVLENFLPTVTDPAQISSGDIITLGKELETLPDYAPLVKAYENFYNAEEEYSIYGHDRFTSPDEREKYKAAYSESKETFYSLLKDTVDDYLERHPEQSIGEKEEEKYILYDHMYLMEEEHSFFSRLDGVEDKTPQEEIAFDKVADWASGMTALEDVRSSMNIPDGQDLYKLLVEKFEGNTVATHDFLNKAGYEGVKYSDGSVLPFADVKLATQNDLEQNNIVYSNVNDFRKELSYANYLFTEEAPELLNDFTRKTVYSSLLSVHDKESLEAWTAAYLKTDIAHEGALESKNGVKEPNILASLGRQALHFNQAERELVGRDIAKLVANRFETFSSDRDLDIMEKQREEITKARPDALVLFRNGDGYIAYGNDADRIFEKKGWQISDAETEKRTVSWVEINKDGRESLNKNFSVFTINTQAELRDFDRGSNGNFVNDNLIASAQQKIEHGRDSLSHDHASIATPGLRYYTHERKLYETTHNIQSMNFDKDNISLVEDNGKVIPLMSNGAWQVNRENEIPLVSLSQYLEEKKVDIAENIKTYGETRENQLSLADKVLDEYSARKYSSPNTIFLMQGSTDSFIFGNDAIYAARELKSPLWQMETSQYRTTPVTVIKDNSYDWNTLELDGKDVRGFKGETTFDRFSLGLELSPLNEGLKNSSHIENAGIYKKKNGEYAIRASIDGVEMPNKTISATEARAYLLLPNGEEKDATLKTITTKAYKENVMKGANVENKLGGVKF